MIYDNTKQILAYVIVIALSFLGFLCPIVLMYNNSEQIKFKNEKNELININEKLKNENKQLENKILSLEDEKSRLESILYTLNINDRKMGDDSSEINN